MSHILPIIYTQARAQKYAQTYNLNEHASVHGRSAEGRAFVKAARLLDALSHQLTNAQLRADAITHNRLLWTAVQADVSSHRSQLPGHLKAKLLSLSLYADRALLAMRTSRDPAPITAMIEINRNVAGGLLSAGNKG
jgi:flagellar biosynthesis regulator FlaF